MLPAASRKILYLSDGLETGYVAPSPSIVNYLGLEDGSTDTLVYAAVKDQRRIPLDEPVLNKVIEVTHSVLLHGDFKVAQLHVAGNILVKCSSAEDANLLHHKVKVCDNLVIGFRKLLYVHVDANPGHVAELIRDAMPHEFKLKTREDYVREMKKLLGQDDDNAGGSSTDAEAGGSSVVVQVSPGAEVEAAPSAEVEAAPDAEADAEVGGPPDADAEAGGPPAPSEAGGSNDGAQGVGSKKRKI